MMTSLLSPPTIANACYPLSAESVGAPQHRHHRRVCTKIQSSGKNQTKTSSSDQDSDKNALIKLAWYSSELLGIVASVFRPPANSEARETSQQLAAAAATDVADRVQVMESIKEDFGRSYFITGDLTLNAYEEDCEFADPAASFRGLRRFKRNCTNFGSLIEKSNMKLTKWEEFEDKGIGHWSFSCVLLFPWRPILSATGFTEYFFDPESGKISRHVEHWNVPKMALLKQILRPGPKQARAESSK